MLFILAALAFQMAPPAEPLAAQLRGLIWYDLQSNAMIGNGNQLAAVWYNAETNGGSATPLHLRDLTCSGGTTRLTCRFALFREGGVSTFLGEVAPDRLACGVSFRRSRRDGQWSIPRLPPGPNGGHSRITIRCRVQS